MNKLLEIKNLKINFSKDKNITFVIRDVSLDIFENEIIAIVGESGCGKSILMQSILRLLATNAKVNGNIFYKNIDLLKLKNSEMRKIRGSEISIVFQDPFSSLNPIMKIGKQILEAIKENGSKEKVIKLLEDVEIQDPISKYNRYPHELSGGERQRVIIAIAIASNPKIIIADEPTTSLDVTIQKGILDLFKKINKKYRTSIIFISHDLSVVKYLCTKIFVMYAGRIVEILNVDSIKNSSHPYTKLLLNSILKKEEESISNQEFAYLDKENVDGCLFYNRCVSKKDSCKKLNSVFFKINKNHFVNCTLYKKNEKNIRS
jgi:oligopeptide/dipeptide ABC transporter ATP-binding protein